MISSLAMNSGSQTFSEKKVRSARADERSGAIRDKTTVSVSAGRVKTYEIQVRNGRLVLAGTVKKTTPKA